jgi:hypothetical protein
MNGIASFFKNLWTKVKPEAEAALISFEQKITPDVYQLAEDAVTAAVSLGGGVASRDAAVTQLEVELAKTGSDAIIFAKAELNALIELVYLAVKPTITSASA